MRLKLAAEGGTLGLMWLIVFLAWLLLAAPVQAQGVRLTCECPAPPNLAVTTCIGTHGLVQEPFACLDDDAKCEPCLYDQATPDFPGRFPCPHSCPILPGADGLLHAASCRSISTLQPIECDGTCHYTDGFYAGETTTTTTTTLPVATAAAESVIFDCVTGDTFPSGGPTCCCRCDPLAGKRVRCQVFAHADPFVCVPHCVYGLRDRYPVALPGDLTSWIRREQKELCRAGEGAAYKLVVRDADHADEDSHCWKP